MVLTVQSITNDYWEEANQLLLPNFFVFRKRIFRNEQHGRTSDLSLEHYPDAMTEAF